jgi:phosphatidate cytidylyltransferase
VLAPIVLAVVACTSPWPVFVLCLGVVCLCLEETRRMLGHVYPSSLAAIAYLVLANLFLTSQAMPRVIFVTTLGVLSVLGVLGSYLTTLKQYPSQVRTQIDGLWPAMPLLALVALHQSHLSGSLWQIANPVLLVLLPVWAGDIAAIYAGRAFGKHPLAPSISPKKTWEGAIANFVACATTGALVGLWMRLGLDVGLACGVVAGTFGQAGDLFESLVKRRAGIKDSGSLLPGHGGIMDRIDSILFVAPAVALILALVPR